MPLNSARALERARFARIAGLRMTMPKLAIGCAGSHGTLKVSSVDSETMGKRGFGG